MTITTAELTYDISRIPAISNALALMPEHELEEGRGPSWDALLQAAAQVMDDGIREALHGEWSDDRTECDFLAVYSARHEAQFGSRFDF